MKMRVTMYINMEMKPEWYGLPEDATGDQVAEAALEANAEGTDDLVEAFLIAIQGDNAEPTISVTLA